MHLRFGNFINRIRKCQNSTLILQQKIMHRYGEIKSVIIFVTEELSLVFTLEILLLFLMEALICSQMKNIRKLLIRRNMAKKIELKYILWRTFQVENNASLSAFGPKISNALVYVVTFISCSKINSYSLQTIEHKVKLFPKTHSIIHPQFSEITHSQCVSGTNFRIFIACRLHNPSWRLRV